MTRPEQVERRAVRHRRRNRYDLVIAVRQLRQRLGKDLRVGLLPGWLGLARLRIIRPQPMKLLLLLQRRLEAASLLRNRVQQHGLVLALQELEGFNQQRQVVPIQRPVVAEAELLEQHARPDQSFGCLFRLARHVPDRLAAKPLQQSGRAIVQSRDRRIGHNLVKVLRNRPHVFVDRPRIVVQHHDQPPGLRGNVVQRLKRDAVGKRRVPAQRHNVFLAARHVPRHGHAQRCAQRRARMSRAVAVMFALRTQHEAVQSPRLPDGLEPVVAAGQNLVHIRLVAHVEDKAVPRRVEDVVHRQRQFHHAQVRANMPAGLGNAEDQPLANLFGKLRQLRNSQPLYIHRRLDPGQQFFHALACLDFVAPMLLLRTGPHPSSIPAWLNPYSLLLDALRRLFDFPCEPKSTARLLHFPELKYHVVPRKYQCLKQMQALPWIRYDERHLAKKRSHTR